MLYQEIKFTDNFGKYGIVGAKKYVHILMETILVVGVIILIMKKKK